MFFKAQYQIIVVFISFFIIISWGQTINSNSQLKIRTHSTFTIRAPQSNSLTMPSDIAVGPKGNIYVVDGVNNRIVVFNSQGKVKFTFGSFGNTKGKFNYPIGITIGPHGDVYIADTGNHRVQIFTAYGSFKKEIKIVQNGKNNSTDITDVSLNPNQNHLYMIDNENHNILVYDYSLDTFKNPWGEPGTNRLKFSFPYLSTVTPDGYLVVVEVINTRVQVLNSKGKFVSFIGSWGVNPGHFFRPKGVAVYDKKIFVTDSYLKCIQVFTIKGKFLGQLCDKEDSPFNLITPTGIAIDTKLKRLYVVELKANQIRCIIL